MGGAVLGVGRKTVPGRQTGEGRMEDGRTLAAKQGQGVIWSRLLVRRDPGTEGTELHRKRGEAGRRLCHSAELSRSRGRQGQWGEDI